MDTAPYHNIVLFPRDTVLIVSPAVDETNGLARQIFPVEAGSVLIDHKHGDDGIAISIGEFEGAGSVVRLDPT